MKAPKSELTKRMLSNRKSIEAFWDALDDNNKAIPLNGKMVYIRRLPTRVPRPKNK